ncbi:PPK2 family polyphosphate kinase [Pseudoduganella umbonata]|uniref:PPK2 family polyphosphate:nucleotide phosphotransferase n=1 Tax=Pseudoduganella umbonata TaxID=864828 RepID=A0A4P8HS50_9BURK|nr:PPK2 family polyphosphate kinase [Pseudoduganella umbonata]MBB3223930.1 PPK2 family polyphosphate:nucleotide phosphotransferase [Pseudoduganella umbonata]QCP12663.1 polyphosphate kinase 2 family protein [Pseudoduganella umbonata]
MKACKLFRVVDRPELADKDAALTPLCSGDEHADRQFGKGLHREIAVLQEMLYAEHRRKVLLVLQGVDCAGKDGTVHRLFRKINPMGLRPVRFDVPTAAETARDFLWRVHLQVPRQGEIAVFNRSHYEDVLHPVVHDLIDGRETDRRYAQIRDFERMLAESGTTIVKVFLHISKDEQRRRLQDRIDDVEKHWKFDPDDLKNRRKWSAYQAAYERAIAETDAPHAPWYIVPADSKPHRDIAVAALLAETMRGMNLAYPPGDPKLAKLRVK